MWEIPREWQVVHFGCNSYRQSDQKGRRGPKCALNARLESLFLIQGWWGATESYEQGERWTRQWVRLNLTAVCKMNCSDKAFFVPWHSCGEMEAPNLVVRGTDPRRANTEALLPLSLAAHQNEFWETSTHRVLPLFRGHCFHPSFYNICITRVHSSDNMQLMGWAHWKIRMEMTLSKRWSN